MGNVAVKCSVPVYTTRIAAAEETWPHSSHAPSEGHTDGAVRKHGSHPCHAKPYGCLRMLIPQDYRECHPQTTQSSRSSASRVGLSLLQRSRLSQSTIITGERGVMRHMSFWMLFLKNTARFSATFSRCTASEMRVS